MIKTFEELSQNLNESKYDKMEDLVDRLYELNAFEQGHHHGYIKALEYVQSLLRQSMKYGDVE